MALAILFFARWARAQYIGYSVGACDLGIFYQAAKGWAFDGWPYVPIKGYAQIGDHFSPVFALLAPLLWIHNSPVTLVYAQVVLICLSGVPIYHIFRRRHGILVGTGMLIAYLATNAVFRTIQFPVHEVMFGALFLAWGLERMLAGKWTQATILFAALITVKEDGGLMCALIGLYALFNRRFKHGAFLIGWGAFWFVVTLKLIIPNVNPGGFTYAKDYQQNLHADGIFAGIPYMLTHPLEILGLMADEPAKVDTWHQLMIPLGFAALASPIALLIVPVILSRMLSSRETQWSPFYYYDMPLIPILFAATADGFRRIGSLVDRVRGLGPEPDPTMAPRRTPDKPAEPPVPGTELPEDPASATSQESDEPSTTDRRPRWQVRTATIMAAVAAPVFFAFALQDMRTDAIVDWYQGTSAPFDSAKLAREAPPALAKIPPGVTVRATNGLVIPLAASNEVYLIGSKVDKGDWAIIDTVSPGCPIGPDQVPTIVKQLNDMGFRQIYATRKDRVIVLQRIAPAVTEIRGTGIAS